MKQRMFGIIGKFGAALGVFWLLSSAPLCGQTIAYQAPVEAGNQNFGGNLGLDFTVNTPILVTDLGAFDSGGTVFHAGTTITVAIVNQATQKIVAGPVTFTHNNPGSKTSGDRFQPLSPAVILPPGNYSVVANGYNTNDPNGNSTLPGFGTPAAEHNGGGAISFGPSRWDANTTIDLPGNLSAENAFLAGTFRFNPPPANTDTFVPIADVTGTDGTFLYREGIVVDKFNTGHNSLAVANWGAGTVSLFLNPAGNGTFSAAVNYMVGSYPRALAVGDLCGHGRSDLAVVNWGDSTVSIMCNQGAGTFPNTATPAPVYSVGPSPYSVAIGDFNGDGNQDLVVADDNFGLTVLLGNGNGTFQVQPTMTDPHLSPASVTVADFNNDGNLDIAAANAMLGTVTVQLGDGHGNFGAPLVTTIGASSRPSFIAAGKFNEATGGMDVAVTDMGSAAVYVLTNWSAVTGQFQVVHGPYQVGMFPTSIAVGDLNGAGHLDLVVSNLYSQGVSVLMGNGDGTFQGQVPFSAAMMWYPVWVGLGAFDDSTSSLDLAVVNMMGMVNILMARKETTSLATAGGNNQFASPGQTFTQPVSVVLAPPVAAGVPVTFSIVAGNTGATASFPGNISTVIAYTDGSGKATSPPFQANANSGPFTITATIGYGNPAIAGAKVTFTEIN